MGVSRGLSRIGELAGSCSCRQCRTVNIAARLQGLTRKFDTDIILTETLRQTIDPGFETHKLPDTLVKAVEKPLAIHALN
jgi:class 3 adenylate cyclase